MERVPPRFWAPLSVYPPRDLPRVAFLRRVWLKIRRDGLRELDSRAVASRRTQLDAVASYTHMLTTIGAVARAAEAGDLEAFYAADIRMDRAILATRKAFTRAGAGHICVVVI